MRLLTFNCLATPFTNKRIRLARIAKNIADLKPDVICLQEVILRRDINFIIGVLEKTIGGIDYFYERGGILPNDLLTIVKGELEEKELIKFDLLKKFYSLAVLDWFCTPGYHRLKVNVKDKHFYLYNLHTTADHFKSQKSKYRKLVVGQISQLTRELRSVRGPVIVCGDFNFQPSSREFNLFTKKLGFKDVFNGEDKITRSKIFSWLPIKPERVDYVFYKKLHFKKLRAKIVFDKPFEVGNRQYYLSDHLGISVDFE